jgi:hypothetical protein
MGFLDGEIPHTGGTISTELQGEPRAKSLKPTVGSVSQNMAFHYEEIGDTRYCVWEIKKIVLFPSKQYSNSNITCETLPTDGIRISAQVLAKPFLINILLLGRRGGITKFSLCWLIATFFYVAPATDRSGSDPAKNSILQIKFRCGSGDDPKP